MFQRLQAKLSQAIGKVTKVQGTVKINGKSYTSNGGDISIHNDGKVYIGGEEVDTIYERTIHVRVEASTVHSVETLSGDVVVVGNVEEVQTMSGDVRASHITGSISTMSGDISLN